MLVVLFERLNDLNTTNKLNNRPWKKKLRKRLKTKNK